MDAYGGMNMTDEPGGQDNRLILRPADFPVIEDWEDGNTYSLKDLGDAKIRQISSGEFQVIPAKEGEATEEGSEPGTTEQPEGGPNNEDKAPESETYANPAVAGMMRGGGTMKGRSPISS